MRKTIFLISALLVLLISGCNEKNLLKDISGTWHVQKYAVDGHDRTYWFDTTFPGYSISFGIDKKYTKYWNTRHIGTVYTVDTIRHFDTITQMVVIDSITSTSAIVPYVATNFTAGDWLLTNSNKYIETRDTTGTTLYQIIDHSSSNLHLYTGNEDYYLAQ